MFKKLTDVIAIKTHLEDVMELQLFLPPSNILRCKNFYYALVLI